MEEKSKIIKFVLWALFVFLLAGAAYSAFFFWKLDQTGKKIINFSDNNSAFETLRNLASSEEINLKGAEKGRINILLLGIAGVGKPGNNLTDTIMVASADIKTGRVALLSIPRDLYVEVPDADFQTKINTVYQHGIIKYGQDSEKSIEPIVETVENITSLDLDYWLVVNFDGFEEIIDAIGGINIMNEKDIYDESYPGPNYSYITFELKKGFHQLDGSGALKYARMRHDAEGDFGRAKRQQQVIQATKNKIFSTGTLLNAPALNELFNALGNNVKTNLDAGELGDLLKLSKKLDTQNINNVVLDAWNSRSLLKVSHVFYQDIRAFVLIPRVGNWSEVQNLAENIFDTNKIQRRRDEISKENARVIIIDQSGQGKAIQKIQKLLKESFEYKNVVVISGKNIIDSSVVYDLSSGQKPFTADELTKKLPAKIAYSLEENYRELISNIETDIVVAVGKDLAMKYNMEEDSVEEYNQAKDTNEYTEFRQQPETKK